MRIITFLLSLSAGAALVSPGSSAARFPSHTRILGAARRSLGLSMATSLKPRARGGVVPAEAASLLPSITLVSGNMIGAGIIALPGVSLHMGFGPSTLVLLSTWAGFVATALLIAEVTVNLRNSKGGGEREEDISIMSMASTTLGKPAGVAACSSFVLLNWSLLVAYISKISEVLMSVSGHSLAVFDDQQQLLDLLGPFCMVAFTSGLALLSGNQNRIGMEKANVSLTAVQAAGFLSLLASLLPGVDPLLLGHVDMGAVPSSVPVLLCAFVFHNVIPKLVSMQDGHVGRIQTSIVVGSAVPLLAYILFNAAVLGSIPLTGDISNVGDLLANNDSLLVFSLAAIMLSSMGTASSQVDEFASLLSAAPAASPRDEDPAPTLPRPEALMEAMPPALALAPPLVVALAFPSIFQTALEIGGSFGDLTLFGLIPVAMACRQRQDQTTKDKRAEPKVEMLPGGMPVLLGLGGLSAALVISEGMNMATQLWA